MSKPLVEAKNMPEEDSEGGGSGSGDDFTEEEKRKLDEAKAVVKVGNNYYHTIFCMHDCEKY